MFMIKKFYYLILCIRISNIDIATNQTTPKNSNKISKSLYLIYIYIYIGGGVYFRYKTSKTGIKTSKLYTTRYALSVRRATISLSPPLLSHNNQTWESLFGSRVCPRRTYSSEAQHARRTKKSLPD